MLFRKLSPTECEVLYTIWSLQRKTGLDEKSEVTAEVLGAKLDKTPAYIRKVISQIRAIGDNYIVTNSCFPSGKHRGRPHASYHLNSEDVITLTDTAFMLMQLVEFPPSRPNLIERSQFLDHLVNKLGMDRALACDPMEVATNVGYVHEYKSGFIFYTDRVLYEQGYILKLAKIFITQQIQH